MNWEERETRYGQTLTKRVWALLEDAYREVGLDPARYLVVNQGSWSHAAASAGTHSGNGAVDLRSRNLPPNKVIPLLTALRKRGMIAWWRHPNYGWTSTPAHIHGVYRYYDDLSLGAKAQVRLYDRGRDGTASNRHDPFPRPEQHPFNPSVQEDEVTPQDKKDIIEGVVAALKPEIHAVADAVWEKKFAELGGNLTGTTPSAHPAGEFLVRGATAAVKAAEK